MRVIGSITMRSAITRLLSRTTVCRIPWPLHRSGRGGSASVDSCPCMMLSRLRMLVATACAAIPDYQWPRRAARSDLVRRRLDAEARKRRQVLIEGPIVPEIRFAAADAAMPGLDREADAVVPAHYTASVVGDRATTAHFVEAIALLGILVIKALDKQPSVVIRTTVARVVDTA